MDDEKSITDILRPYFEREGFVVVTTDSGTEALKLALEGRTDLVVLDLMLPDMSGEEVCERIRQDTEIPVLMLTARADVESRIQGLRLGADDYVAKPFSPREVVQRALTILRRTGTRSGGKTDRVSLAGGRLRIDSLRHEVSLDGQEIELTPLEFALLLALARAPGRAFSRAQLVGSVYDTDYEGYERNIDVHIKNLRRKLFGCDCIKTVFGVGYKLVVSDHEDRV
ncbi:response regulator transcription factor [bacterium]|nr:response regulator transcription factor [bacterium]